MSRTCTMKSSLVYFAAFLFLCAALFGVGAWEANVALRHQPTSESTPGLLQGYIFTIVSSILNIVGSIISACLLICHVEDEQTSTATSLSCIVIIWSIVLFAGMINHDIYTGPFQDVVIVQFCITMIGTCLACSSCIGFVCILSRTHESDKVEV